MKIHWIHRKHLQIHTQQLLACTCFLSQFCTVFRLADFTFYLFTLYSTLLMLYTLNSSNSHCQLQNYCDFFLPLFLSFFLPSFLQLNKKPLWSQWTGVSRHGTTKTGAHEGATIYITNPNTNKCTTVRISGQLDAKHELKLIVQCVNIRFSMHAFA